MQSVHILSCFLFFFKKFFNLLFVSGDMLHFETVCLYNCKSNKRPKLGLALELCLAVFLLRIISYSKNVCVTVMLRLHNNNLHFDVNSRL